MKKITIIAVAFALSMISSISLAESFVKAGLTVTGYDLTGKGTERSRGVLVEKTVDIQAPTASVFAEVGYGMDVASISVGVDIIPYDIDSETITNARTDSQTNTVSATLQNNYGAYLLLSHNSGAYIKAMASWHEVVSNETIDSAGSTYGNDDIMAGHVSVGYEKDMGEYFVRGELGRSEFEKAKFTSSSGNTTTTAHLKDGTHARISIGKQF